jgi:exocyst complex component 7
MLEEAQEGYADMRGGWAKRCLEPGTKWIVAAAEKDVGTVDGGRDFGFWVEGMLALAEVSCPSLENPESIPIIDGICASN